MLFNSFQFMLFLPVVMALHYAAPMNRRNLVLTAASYVFYGCWDVRFTALLLLSTAWGYLCGRRIHASADPLVRRGWVVASVVVNLAVLGVFKYANFFLDSLAALMPGLPSELRIVLPVGISFYTFQSMSYALDIYRNDAAPVESFTDFACYIALFPQLVAGPIVRFREIASQLSERGITLEAAAEGIRRFTVGLAKKLLVADTLAPAADALFNVNDPSTGAAWLGAVIFSLQIYFDFSGYSDMAVGLGRMLGFRFPENFDFPYQASSIADFWRRWHRSLSFWLRDYLYIPLGGSRKGEGRTIRNLLITFLLCGLWHGAAWHFVAWGAYYGGLLVAGRFLGRRLPSWLASWGKAPLAVILKRLAVYVLVVIGWVMFRAEDCSQAADWLAAMAGFGTDGAAMPWPSGKLMVFLAVVQIGVWWWPRHPDGFAGGESLSPGSRFGLSRLSPLTCDVAHVLLLGLCVLAILGADASPFLYYQF